MDYIGSPRTEHLHAEDPAAALFNGEHYAARQFSHNMGLGHPVELQVGGNNTVALGFCLCVSEADFGKFRVDPLRLDIAKNFVSPRYLKGKSLDRSRRAAWPRLGGMPA